MFQTANIQRRYAGFTLLEILITIVIVGILAAVAYPSFLNQVRKSRRSDAVDAAAKVMQAQERYRGNNVSYGTLAQLATYGVSGTSGGGYYGVAVSSVSGTGYTVTLTGAGSQAADTGCTTMTVTVTAGNGAYTPATCWSR